MDSLQELREWCGRDTEALREVKMLKKTVRECESEVVLTEKDIHTVDRLIDYFMRHRNLKYLEEMAGINDER